MEESRGVKLLEKDKEITLLEESIGVKLLEKDKEITLLEESIGAKLSRNEKEVKALKKTTSIKILEKEDVLKGLEKTLSTKNQEIKRLSRSLKTVTEDLLNTFDDVNQLTNSYRYRLGDKAFKIINTTLGRGVKDNYFFELLNDRHKDYLLKKIDKGTDEAIASDNFKLSFNINDIKDKTIVKNSYKVSQTKKRRKAVIVVWDIGHNPVGRAFLFAEFLSKDYDTTLIGPIFEQYGSDVWGPIRNRGINIISFKGSNLPGFAENVEMEIKGIKADLIIVCKPRIPSILIGSRIKELNKSAPILLDIDDHELSFFKDRTLLEGIDNIDLSSKEGKNPYSEVWTRHAESIVDFADEIVVSNEELQKRFGGTVIPHVRNEDVFNPRLYPRKDIRKRIGYKESDQVILFIGTPRFHKGIVQIADALDKIHDNKVKFCVIGSIEDVRVIDRLKKLPKSRFKNLDNISFDDLPYYLSIGDVICLYQDPNSAISEYQMPAKVSDALSMNIPVIASSVKPLKNLEKHKFIHCVEDLKELDKVIVKVLKDSKEGDFRKFFLKTHSFSSGRKAIRNILKSIRTDNNFVSPLQKLRPSNLAGGINVAFFWKQNDSDIYGRRQDMMVKYLSKNAHINKIMHFDQPIQMGALKDMKSSDEMSQSNFIYKNTLERIDHRADENAIFKRTFVYKGAFKESEYLKFIEEELAEANIKVTDTIFWFCPIIPSQRKITEYFKPLKIVSDVIDDQTQFTNNLKVKKSFKEQYKFALETSVLNLCNTDTVEEKFVNDGFALKRITNGAEFFTDEELESWPMPKDLDGLQKPILGYVGNLDPVRLDLELIEGIAKANPTSSLVFIGSAHRGGAMIDLAQRYSNIHILGVRKYNDALVYINQFDVALIPHNNNEMTRFMNPLKLYNYASIGKPIVSTRLDGLKISYDGLFISDTSTAFIENITKTLQLEKVRFNLPEEFLWNNKVDEIVDILKS